MGYAGPSMRRAKQLLLAGHSRTFSVLAGLTVIYHSYFSPVCVAYQVL